LAERAEAFIVLDFFVTFCSNGKKLSIKTIQSKLSSTKGFNPNKRQVLAPFGERI